MPEISHRYIPSTIDQGKESTSSKSSRYVFDLADVCPDTGRRRGADTLEIGPQRQVQRLHPQPVIIFK